MFPWNLFPFNKDSKDKMDQMKPQDIQKYIQEMMDKLMPDSLQKMQADTMFRSNDPFGTLKKDPNTTKKEFNYLVFETHHHVYIRIPIIDETWLQTLKIHFTSSQVILKHIPTPENKQIINLPCLVRRKGSVALYKDSILEIRMPKNLDIQYSEIDVTEMD